MWGSAWRSKGQDSDSSEVRALAVCRLLLKPPTIAHACYVRRACTCMREDVRMRMRVAPRFRSSPSKAAHPLQRWACGLCIIMRHAMPCYAMLWPGRALCRGGRMRSWQRVFAINLLVHKALRHVDVG